MLSKISRTYIGVSRLLLQHQERQAQQMSILIIQLKHLNIRLLRSTRFSPNINSSFSTSSSQQTFKQILSTIPPSSLMQTNILFAYFTVAILLFVPHYALTGPYSHDSTTSLVNTTWMTLLGDGIPLRKLSLLGTHVTFYTPSVGLIGQDTQTLSLEDQLKSGIRMFDVGCRHYYDAFTVHYGIWYLGVSLGKVLQRLQTWLTNNPKECVVLRVAHDTFDDRGNTRTFNDTMREYMTNFSSLIWSPINTSNPVLGEIRGKVVILQAFSYGEVFGIDESSFLIEPDIYYTTNWYQYTKWEKVKLSIVAANSGKPMLSFWTGYGGSFPWFVASGKTFAGTNSGQLTTGLVTPFFKSSYPDFPRGACALGMCTIFFQGLNKLGMNYISNNGVTKTGWVFVNHPGDAIIAGVNNLNYKVYAPCKAIQQAAGCSSCAVNGTCLSCDTFNNYVYDATSFSCLAAPSYYLASPYPLPCNSSIFGCSLCSDAVTCIGCNSTSHYALDASTPTCIAAPGYYLNSSNIPVACNITLIGCKECTSDTVCTACDSSLYFMLQGTQCVCDNAQHFIQSTTQPVCICQAGYYNSAGVCVIMPDQSLSQSGCTNPIVDPLAPLTTCTSCDSAAFFQLLTPPEICICSTGYYYDGTACSVCNTTLTGCTSCQTSTLCLSCASGFNLMMPSCYCPVGTFLAVATSTCDTCGTGCLVCTGLTACSSCDTSKNFLLLINNTCDCQVGYFLDVTVETCKLCSAMAGCLECKTSGCTLCDASLDFSLNTTTNLCICPTGFYIGANNLCNLCSMDGCLQCTSLTVCTSCDVSSFFLNTTTSKCDQICGDGLVFQVQCDDGNSIDGDGCSSHCTIQPDYSCVGGSTTMKSVCSYNKPLYLNFVKAVKQKLSNTIKVDMTISPPLKDLSALDFNQILSTNITQVSSISFSYDGQGNIAATIKYNESLQNSGIQVDFMPPVSAAFYYTQPSSVAFAIQSIDNQGVYNFSDNIYQLQILLQQICTYLGYAFLGCTLAGLSLSRVIPVEMIGVGQVAFMGLMLIDYLQPLLLSLIKIYPVNGINTMFSQNGNDNILPSRVSGIGLGSQFLVNLNYSIGLTVVPFVVGLVCLIVSKTCGSSKQSVWQTYAKRSVCQLLLSVLLILMYAVVTFAALHLRYSNTTSNFYSIGAAGSAFLIIATTLMLILYLLKKGSFGQFYSLFKKDGISSRFCLFTFTYRLVFSVLVVFLNDQVVSVYTVIALPALMIILLAVKRPYMTIGNNLRAISNQFSCLIILAVYTYYRIQITANNSIPEIALYLPILVVALLFMCLVVNVTFLFLNLGQAKKQKAKEIEKLNQLKYQERQTQEAELTKQVYTKITELWALNKGLNVGRIPATKRTFPETSSPSPLNNSGSDELELTGEVQILNNDVSLVESTQRSPIKMQQDSRVLRKRETGRMSAEEQEQINILFDSF